jgi:hypothetical protein
MPVIAPYSSPRAEPAHSQAHGNLFNKYKGFSELIAGRHANGALVSSAKESELLRPEGQTGTAGDLASERPVGGPANGDRTDAEADSGPAPLGSVYWDPLALFTAPSSVAQGASLPTSAPAQVPEPLVAEIVRSIAWGGDRRRGSARLTLGGRFDGAAIRIDASDGRLEVELQAPPGVDAAELLKRLGERLHARGLVVDSLTAR